MAWLGSAVLCAALALAPAGPAFAGTAGQARAAYKPLGSASAERFDQRLKAWRSLPVAVDFDAVAEAARVRLPRIPLDQPLYVRLDLKALPGYAPWIAARKAQGGALWKALEAVLGEVGEGPVLALTHQAPGQQVAIKVLLGLRKGSRFEPYATVPGRLSPCGSGLCFEPAEPGFNSTSTGLAWSLLKPWALGQLKGER